MNNNTNYIMTSIDEYFEKIEKDNNKRQEMVSKALVRYLQKSNSARQTANILKERLG